MNCAVCKYEFYHDDKDGGFRIGDEYFIYFAALDIREEKAVTLYICPKCKTIRGE